MNADGIEAEGKFPGWSMRHGVQDLYDCKRKVFLNAYIPKLDSNCKERVDY